MIFSPPKVNLRLLSTGEMLYLQLLNTIFPCSDQYQRNLCLTLKQHFLKEDDAVLFWVHPHTESHHQFLHQTPQFRWTLKFVLSSLYLPDLENQLFKFPICQLIWGKTSFSNLLISLILIITDIFGLITFCYLASIVMLVKDLKLISSRNFNYFQQKV